jgi:hypothetical protein
MAEEDINIFEESTPREFEKEALLGVAKGMYDGPKTIASYAAMPLSLFGAGVEIDIPELTEILPVLSQLENQNPEDQIKFLESLDIEATGPEAAGFGAGFVGGAIGSFEGLTQIKKKYPEVYKKLRKAFPYSVGQLHVKYRVAPGGKLNKFAQVIASAIPKGLKKADRVKQNTPIKNIIKNFAKLAKFGFLPGLLAPTEMGDATLFDEDGYIKQEIIDADPEMFENFDLIGPGGLRPPEENKTDTAVQDALDDLGVDYIDKEEKIVDNKALGGEPSLDTNIFEESEVVTDGPEEVQMANLFGKVPIWAIGQAKKSETLTQGFSKAIKKALDSIQNKLGTKDEVLGDTIEDIDLIDTPSGETVVGTVKNKKTIIDSPEPNESVFYSELEARLMDPNTPKSFNNKEQLFNFLNQKGISKVEVEDNILNRYIDIANKNNTPLLSSDMLEIVRQAPMRKVQSVTYGDARYGGTKRAKYDGYQETGALPNSYREEVLYLPAEDIPLDPGTLPQSGHDFAEKYVIGWSRLTDRKATLPVDKTAQGIAEQVDPAMIRTLKRNQKTLDRQLKGLETSALRKLEREGLVDIDNVDELTMAEIRNVLDTNAMARLRSVDEPLEQQILQFRMKIDGDAAKLQKMEAATKGQQITVTFADEVQSDILQQAKRMEEKFTEQLADLMDANTALRSAQIRSGGYKYGDITPEVAEYFLKNKTVFRPIFQTAQEMQGFLDEFAKGEAVFKELSEAGLQPSKDLLQRVAAAQKKEKELLSTLEKSLSQESMQKLMPNVPFKSRSEWGSALLKMNVNNAAKRLFVDKVDDAAEWFAISPSKLITRRYNQSGGTNVPPAERTKDMKGIGMEEFYGGPTSTDYKGKHYTSVLEKEMKRLARENNSEFKVIKIDNVGDAFAIKLTPEMLLPHKTHRNKGGMVYTPELIDIFEAA